VTLSHDSKYHAIFATSSISEAIQYYRLFKDENIGLKIAALFDPSIDNNGTGIIKEDAIVEIVDDYNKRYGMEFRMSTYSSFKKDISYRLAHKEQYKSIEKNPEQQIDLLIVVDQMLTGFDSKWINTLYMDKVCVYEKLIQAFSRTNRLYGPEKPFGTIRYYRRPHTMKRNIEEAFKLYSGDKPLGLFADKLEYNLRKMNEIFDDINALFHSAGIDNFEKLPENYAERGVFAKLFKRFNNYLEAAKIQGFTWVNLSYEVNGDSGKERIDLRLDETVYLVLALRYKELFGSTSVTVEDGKTLRDYITEYMTRAKNDQIYRFSIAIGVDESELRSFLQIKVTDANINEFGRFDRLKATIDTVTAKTYLEKVEGKSIKPFQVNMKIDQVLRMFILDGGFDL
jgi:type I restriction enzyme R subunit